MQQALKLLIVEDLERDAELVLLTLSRNGFEVDHERVDTAEAMSAALRTSHWDAIVSDYHMPRFSAPDALKILQANGKDLPFIVVSGMMGEEAAVEMMRLGAHDYVMKDKLARLPLALDREMREASNRRQRRIAEAGRHESETRLQAVLENTPVVFAEIDLDGRYLLLNNAGAAVLNSTPPQVVGQTLREVLAPAAADVFLQRIREVQSTGRPVQVEDDLETDGGVRHFVSTLFPLFDEGGHVQSVGSIAQDITERKQMEETLVAALEEKTRLVAELFHRTNNNIQVIQALLRYRLSANPDLPLSQFVDDVIGQIQSMAQAQQALFRAGNLSRIDLAGYLRSVVQLVQDRYPDHREAVSVSLYLQPLTILLDSAVPLGLVVTELVTNAFRHAFCAPREDKSEGEITVTCTAADTDEIEVRVCDNGTGWSPAIGSAAPGVGGLGLTVALVEQQLNGTITFDGNSGTTCVVRFCDNRYEERV